MKITHVGNQGFGYEIIPRIIIKWILHVYLSQKSWDCTKLIILLFYLTLIKEKILDPNKFTVNLTDKIKNYISTLIQSFGSPGADKKMCSLKLFTLF